jgi:hypothetical protein
VWQCTSTTLIDMSRKEELQEGGASEVTTSVGKRKRRKGTGNQVDSKTGELGQQIQEAYIGEQSWNGTYMT